MLISLKIFVADFEGYSRNPRFHQFPGRQDSLPIRDFEILNPDGRPRLHAPHFCPLANLNKPKEKLQGILE